MWVPLKSLLPLYHLVFPGGMASRVLYTDNRDSCAYPDVCLDVCGSSTGSILIIMLKLAY